MLQCTRSVIGRAHQGVRHIRVKAHQKQSMLNKVRHRLFLFIRFGMRSLQVASKFPISTFLVQLAPSAARISISRTGHQKQESTATAVLFCFCRSCFGNRSLQVASNFTLSAFSVQLAPSTARISISRTAHHYRLMLNTST